MSEDNHGSDQGSQTDLCLCVFEWDLKIHFLCISMIIWIYFSKTEVRLKYQADVIIQFL